jgi:hypothetical protein
MGQFTTTPLQPVTAIYSTQLRTRIFATAERDLQAYLIATHVEGSGPVIQFLHRPGVRLTPLDSTDEDEQYGFIGDARHGQPPMLALWPERVTGQTKSANVLSDTGTNTALSGDPDLVILGPFPDAQAGVEAFSTLRAMYLPTKYAPLPSAASSPPAKPGKTSGEPSVTNRQP